MSGGGGGDGGAQKMEEQRQARVQSAVEAINRIFNGGSTQGVNAATTYDPSRTYYTADGSKFSAPKNTVREAVSTGLATSDSASPDWEWRNREVVDQNAIDGLLRNGQLFTDSQAVPGKGRSALYDQQRTAVTDLNRRDVDRQFLDAERQNRFGLARAGLSGGSADIDSNAELTRRTNEGLIKAAGIGDQAAADLQTADERSRQNLISMAQSGIDTGQAAQMALSQLDANSANAASARSGATVGNLFGDLAQAYLYGQQQQGARAGAAPYQQWMPGANGNPRNSYQGS
ncbi:hypothetical protein [Achromobacter sp. 2789STDY5608628]|uniref:hypothetical protein n=1 Tax=Achromobacter sp. 2789STDY5608628 TaxID=1806493 RepID=UPI0006BFEDE1|nr:hypothetical protein [Achromobacter sp. 2789STDY5608628]CUJ67177.1 Uncharacterised protein [Achromobacter sp. 2789STDY5608628]